MSRKAVEFPGLLSSTARAARFTSPAAKDGHQVDKQFQFFSSITKDPIGENVNPVVHCATCM